METVFNEIQHSVKNWWASLLLGIVYIIVALWLMFAPLSSYVALSIVFSISMLISGILEILFAVSNRKGVPSWGWYIVGGIIDVILGIYLIAYPMVSMEVIPFIIAFWLMFWNEGHQIACCCLYRCNMVCCDRLKHWDNGICTCFVV